MDFLSWLLNLVNVVLPGVLTALLTALIIWLIARVWRVRRGSTPAFMLRRLRGSDWFLERVPRRIALEVWLGEGHIVADDENGIRQYGTIAFGDMERGASYQVATDGQTVWVAWIDKGKRKHSPAYVLGADGLSIAVRPSIRTSLPLTTQV